MQIIELNNSSFDKEKIKQLLSKKICLVGIFSKLCIHCQNMKPQWDFLKKKLKKSKCNGLLLEIDSDHIFIDQNLATETENINPFAVLTGKGTVELSPASDTWIERRSIPALVVDGGTIRKTINVTILNGGKLTNKKGPQGSTGKGGPGDGR